MALFSCLFCRISCFPGGRLAFPQCAQESKSIKYIPPFLPPYALLLNTSNHTVKPVINSWMGSSNECRYFGFTCLHLRVCGRSLKAESLSFSWGGQVVTAQLCVYPCPVTQTTPDSSTYSSSAAASAALGSSSKALNPFSQAGSLHLKAADPHWDH